MLNTAAGGFFMSYANKPIDPKDLHRSQKRGLGIGPSFRT